MLPSVKNAVAAAALTSLAPISAIGAESQSSTYDILSKSELEMAEGLAFRIAEALYRIDYLNPNIDPDAIDGVINPILTDAQPSPQMRRYIGEILDLWFVSQPRVVEAVARTFPEHSQQLQLAELDPAASSPTDATAAIPSSRRINIPKPPAAVSRGSSDY